MALRLKTIEYAWPFVTTPTVEASVYTSADITVFIPEVNSRVFRSVMLDVTAADNMTGTAVNIAALNMGLSCNGGTNWTDRNITIALTQTGETHCVRQVADVTAEFTARFGSGTSNSGVRFRFQLDLASVGASYLNISAKLVITYEFDDAGQTTRICTARIPIESILTRPAAATRTAVGGAQIPALDSFLPEAGKTYRAIFFEGWCQTAPSGTTDGTITLDLDSGTPSMVTGTIENGYQTPICMRLTWDLLAAGLTTNATHTLYQTASGVSMYPHGGGWITVTYEYDHDATTTFLNSVMLPAGPVSGTLVTATADRETFPISFVIGEPGPITLVQSGVMVIGPSHNTAGNLRVAVGGQSYRTYTGYQQTGQAGHNPCVMHRFDSGAAQGVGATLAQGRNTVTVSLEASAGTWWGTSVYLVLNYTSGKHPAGCDAHLHTIQTCLIDTQRAATTAAPLNATAAIPIPETLYHMSQFGLILLQNQGGTNGGSVRVSVRYAAGDRDAEYGWVGTGIMIAANSERSWISTVIDVTEWFQAFPGDPRSSRDLLVPTSRVWQVLPVNAAQMGLLAMVTYSATIARAAGNLTGYTGDGSGIDVKLYRADDGLILAEGVTNGGGAFSLPWYAPIECYVTGRQSDVLVGRSGNANLVLAAS